MRSPRGQTAFCDNPYAAPSVSAESPDADRQAQRQRWQAQKMDALARLAGGVAHEFNNFLMAIMGYTEMLASRTSATGEPCQEIEDIRDLCRDATTLTQQLLTFGRRQARQLVVLDVNQLVAELERPLRQALGGDVTSTVILAPAPALVRADRGATRAGSPGLGRPGTERHAGRRRCDGRGR